MRLTADVRRAYDRVAERYAETFWDELSRKPFDRERLDRFASVTRRRGPVLDLGCGPAHVAAYLRERGVDALGLDLSPAMGTVARRLAPDLAFVVADMRRLPFRSGTLAGVAAFYSVIHLDRADVPGALADIRRVLRSGAPLLLAVHGGTGITRTDEFLGERVSVEATLFGLDELAGLVAAAGFEVTEAVARDPYPFEHQTPRLYVAGR